MKQTRLWLATIAVLLCSLAASAHDFETGGIYYNITSSTDLTVAVTYRGNYYESYSNEYTGAVTIPSTATYNSKTYSVTSIGEFAFSGCSSLAAITIPESVTSIGYDAFYGCSSLTSITIPEGVTSIGESAFSSCSSLTAITIPESVTSIGDYAFRNCSSLTSITIPESVTSIGDYAFSDCMGLKELIIEDGNNDLILGGNGCWSSSSYGSFYGGVFSYLQLETIYLGRNLNSHKQGSSERISHFINCEKLKSVKIGDNVTNISDGIFLECYNLTSITIPEGVTSIGSSAFYSCSSLTSITIPEGVTSIGDYAFEDCSSLISITIPEGVTSIGEWAFRNCSSLTAITLPDNSQLTSIGSAAFAYCHSLTSITIPEGVTSIGNHAFYNCNSLTAITIPEGVTSIGSYAFCYCKKLYKVINLSNLSFSKGSNAYGDVAYHAKILWQGGEFITIGDFLFHTVNGIHSLIDYIGKDTEVLLPDNYNGESYNVGAYTFSSYNNLHSVTIGSGVLSIGSHAFGNLDKVIWLTNTPPTGYTNANGNINYVSNNQYTSLRNVKVYPYLSSMFEVDGVKYVPVSPSERTCHAIDCAYDSTAATINVSETASFKGVAMKVTEVMPYTFYGNNYIKEASITHSGNINDYTFYGCSFLEAITLGENISSLGNYAFSGCVNLQEFIVPEPVKTIGTYCFQNCSSLPEISIPQATTRIGDYAFSGCTQLADVIIEDRTTTLNLGSNGSSSLFVDCPLDSVYIGGKITYSTTSSKGYSPFYRNTSLRTVVITDREEQIYDNEFYGCTNLKNVTIGNGVKSIGDYAFSGCSSLDGFSFGSNMESIGAEAFSDCTNLTTITSHAAVPPTCGTQALDDINKWSCTLRVPSGYAAAYQTAEQWKEFFFIEDVVEVEKYILTYVVDGEVYRTDSLAHNATIVRPETPTKEGYSFSGWRNLPTTMPAEDVTISGTFIVNKYLVTFKIGDEVIAADSLEYGATIVVPEAPEKEGYTFDGWGEVEETVPAEDVTYEGSYTVNTYKVYYCVGEALVHTAEVAYGEAIPEYIYEPTGEGDIFEGWVGETYETMPAHDVTYTANITNGIGSSVLNAQGSPLIYDLAGRKVLDSENLKGGVYIINGKKVVIND